MLTLGVAAAAMLAAEPRGSVSIPWWVYPILFLAIVIVSSLGPLSRMAERREARKQERLRAAREDPNGQAGPTE
jgi:hypothetical protein